MADVVFHSSGSTGTAKEIVRSEESLQEDARRLVIAFPEILGTEISGDRPLVVASVRPEHMYGALWCVRAPALANIRVAAETIVAVEQLLPLSGVCPHGLVFVTTPSFLEKAIKHPDFGKLKGCFRAIITSGSALRRETAFAVLDATGVCPLEIYGSTEAGTVAWRRQCDGDSFTLMPDVFASIKPLGTDPREGILIVDSPYALSRPFEMGDSVEMVDTRHFVLKGRADRRVKILERYVSLGEVETALAEHPFVKRVRVESFGVAVPRLGALVVLTEKGRTTLMQDGRETVVSSLRAFLIGKLDAVAIPRRMRFVRELPVNAQGKTTAAAACSALCAWCREPIVTAWQSTADQLLAEMVFPSDMECFAGHFPGFPILPGVAQLYFLRHFARQVFPDWPEAATYRKLKFQKIIRPGSPVALTVSRREEGSFAFEFVLAGGRSTSGLIERLCND